MENNLILICAIAFAAVLTILSLLAGVIAGICKLFPVKAADLPDPAPRRPYDRPCPRRSPVAVFPRFAKSNRNNKLYPIPFISMIFTEKKKEIRVMFTPFRDGLQSVFGGKTRLNDILPAIEASAAAGIRHFEFGGGARFQAPFFYVGEDPFKCMAEIRKTVGPDADLQILTRSVSGVTLTTQRTSTLALQAKLMHKHGTTIDRNFDFMNDVDNLVKTGQPIVDSGMHHQVCVALMGLPFRQTRHTHQEFYINIVRELLKRDIHFDSVCLKDASGTTDPHTCYETAKGIKAILPPEIPLVQHTHDTASTAVACYMAGIAGGVDSIDLAVRPLASGTSQPDVRSMAHALKGTGYSLDIDPDKMDEIESILNKGLSEYEFNPVTTSADARVVGFPMPGGAIGAKRAHDEIRRYPRQVQ